MSTTLPYQESLRAPVQDTGHSSTVSSLQGKAPDSDSHQIPPPSSSVIVYSPRQILLLYASPLVKPPIGIPALKDWFGYVWQI
ncbi:hypothetical protein SERLADRAFT_458713 [Serpula lacrymans var. lacrymans S7.9]|uniref:Uncharacterized protein n=1 Tax=Serpula lacrymans var. lacrymans (strain S7.9) TaxID=578457 RepID=F8NK09_SERL9|nr:uncharacterized protein SERLADRAFT_458713 [Serpula lacrymans var. lacrymans S7.9]EGO28321.1 hypothetical protein SERLADRAFT_458713 [Serpula lacrymans var. lacrymans S7.9]